MYFCIIFQKDFQASKQGIYVICIIYWNAYKGEIIQCWNGCLQCKSWWQLHYWPQLLDLMDKWQFGQWNLIRSKYTTSEGCLISWPLDGRIPWNEACLRTLPDPAEGLVFFLAPSMMMGLCPLSRAAVSLATKGPAPCILDDLETGKRIGLTTHVVSLHLF